MELSSFPSLFFISLFLIWPHQLTPHKSMSVCACLRHRALRPTTPLKSAHVAIVSLTNNSLLRPSYLKRRPTCLSRDFLIWDDSFSVLNLFKISSLRMWSCSVMPCGIRSLRIHHVSRSWICELVRRHVLRLRCVNQLCQLRRNRRLSTASVVLAVSVVSDASINCVSCAGAVSCVGCVNCASCVRCVSPVSVVSAMLMLCRLCYVRQSPVSSVWVVSTASTKHWKTPNWKSLKSAV